MLMLKFTFTKAAEYAGIMIQRSDRTVCKWRKSFFENGGEVPMKNQGRYQRSGILWSSEELNNEACKFVCSHANVKGLLNKRIMNNDCFQTQLLNLVSQEALLLRLQKDGFISPKKGSFVDGHELENVVQHQWRI